MTAPAPTMVNVRFHIDLSRAALAEAFAAEAPDIAKTPKMHWKIWAFDEATHEFASVYLFDDVQTARAFLDGPVIQGLYTDPAISEVRLEVHEVVESLSLVTHAPIVRSPRGAAPVAPR